MKAIHYESSYAYAERYVIDHETNTIVEIWLCGQKSPVGAIAAAFLDNGNRKAESGIWLDGEQVNFGSGEQYSVEEHKDKVPGVGIANRVKLLHIQATGKCDPKQPIYVTSERSRYKSKPPKPFYGRLFQASHIAAEESDIQSLWDYGFYQAMYVPDGDFDVDPCLLFPIEEIEGHDMWAYKIKPYPSLWWSVQRRFKNLVHIIKGKKTRNTWNYSYTELFNALEFDSRFRKFWDYRLEGDQLTLWHRRGENWVQVEKRTIDKGSVYNKIIIMSAKAGIEVMFEDRWEQWQRMLKGESDE